MDNAARGDHVTDRPVRLLDQVRGACRIPHYSVRTEQAYVYWTGKFVLTNGKRRPRELGRPRGHSSPDIARD